MYDYLRLTFYVCLLHFGTAQNDVIVIENDDAGCSSKLDLIFVLDSSHSIKQHNFDIVKKWVKMFTKSLYIEQGDIQVGVVTYSSYSPTWTKAMQEKYVKTEVELGEHKNFNDFKGAVDRIVYEGYKTYTAQALNKTLNEDFVSANSRYPDAQRILILVTDGRATDHNNLQSVVQRAVKEFGVLMYAVGVGNYSEPELLLISNNHTDRVIKVETFAELQKIISKVQKRIESTCDCEVGGSVDEDCDPCSKECVCKRNIVGRRCNSCRKGYYGYGKEDGCLECNCDLIGTDFSVFNNTCDQTTGQCECKSEYFGQKCEKCNDGYERSNTGSNECVSENQRLPTPKTETTSKLSTLLKSTTIVSKVTTTKRLKISAPTITSSKMVEPVRTTTSTPRRCCWQRWPSYCHGWLCRKRWPYHAQIPSPRRCYAGNWACRQMVENKNYGYNNNYYSGSQLSYHRGYYRHARNYRFRYRMPQYYYHQQVYRPPVRYNLYKN